MDNFGLASGRRLPPVCVGVVLEKVAVRSPKLLDGRGVAIGMRRGTCDDAPLIR
jgi:hypothetical protein